VAASIRKNSCLIEAAKTLSRGNCMAQSSRAGSSEQAPFGGARLKGKPLTNAKEVYRFFVTLSLGQFLFKCLMWTVQRLTYFKIFRIMALHLEDVNPTYLGDPPGFTGRYLDRESCRKLANDPNYDLRETFLDRALKNGDKCYAFMRDDVIASCGWYSDKPGLISDRFHFHYDNAYIYKTGGFTLPRFRGQRLHGFNMVAGLKDYTERGCKGLICIVEAQNYNALRSDYRVGWTIFGTIFVVRLFGRYFIRATKGCDKHSCTMTLT